MAQFRGADPHDPAVVSAYPADPFAVLTDPRVKDAGLARAAVVSRSWLYTQPDLLEQLQQRSSDKTTHSTTVTRASDASLQRRLELAHQRITQQTEEIRKLRDQLARAHGDLRAATIARPTGR